jgi:hypothetical protein
VITEGNINNKVTADFGVGSRQHLRMQQVASQQAALYYSRGFRYVVALPLSVTLSSWLPVT